MSKQSDDSEKNVDTQPSRIKKKQQKVLAIGIIIVSLLGWVFYSLLSGHVQSSHTVHKPSSQRMAMDNPTTHVDSSEVFIEKTQNELSQNTKNNFRIATTVRILEETKRSNRKKPINLKMTPCRDYKLN